jgi:hypothetical protein
VLFGDGHVCVFKDRDGDGIFGINDEVEPHEQRDLGEAVVFDGVPSFGRRSSDAFGLR